MSDQPHAGSARALVPSARARQALINRLSAVTGQMTTATIAAMDAQHPWFRELDAEHRSWITVVARTGIDGFVAWFADESAEPFLPSAVFDSAPKALTRRISLHQTVELVRTTIDVVETQIGLLLPRGDRMVLQTAVVHYSREVAFAAAEVYARAAEVRGAWDARLEAMLVDAIVRADTDETVVSRASTLGWRSGTNVTVVVGAAPPDSAALDLLRRAASTHSLDLLAAMQGDRLVTIIGGPGLTDPVSACEKVSQLEEWFGAGPVVVGPLVEDLKHAALSARAANSGYRAAKAWPEGPRTMLSIDLLPERALAGDGHARRALANDVYAPLLAAGGDLLETCVAFLDQGTSVEATSRQLFVHPNTVRYRTKRIQEVTGYNPCDPREAYVLRLAITLGRLLAKPASVTD
ncbi:MAG: helix-turn-helix domain-containing protein [Propionibacteriaceae bacterium]|nr:helix-turn-helix domain-containing protein [Propionibacteriaceae bacterium]